MTNVYIKVDWSQTPKIRFLHARESVPYGLSVVVLF